MKNVRNKRSAQIVCDTRKMRQVNKYLHTHLHTDVSMSLCACVCVYSYIFICTRKWCMGSTVVCVEAEIHINLHLCRSVKLHIHKNIYNIHMYVYICNYISVYLLLYLWATYLERQDQWAIVDLTHKSNELFSMKQTQVIS